MPTDRPADAGPRVTAVVVTHESAAVIESCLAALRAGAVRRPLDIVVVDNASTDGSAELAARLIGPERVVRLGDNRGFATGVNAVLRDFSGPWLAVVNPDLVVPAGAIDGLIDALEARPRAGLAGPRVREPDGGIERSSGLFPSLARERAHALFLDVLAGREGRRAHLPEHAGAVDWLSGCAWVLRGEALREVGPLDEAYFMYFEDVDYCRRLHAAGWDVLAVPEVEVVHGGAQGSTRSALLPADGGEALFHYFRKHHPEVRERELRGVLVGGWRLRHAWHALRALLGSRRAAVRARRYALALERARRDGVAH